MADLRARAPQELAAGRRHRPFRPDAWRRAARRSATACCARRSSGTTCAPSAECAELERRAPRAPAHHRQSRHARLHGAEAAVGGGPRAGDLRADRPGPAAEGLPAPGTHRRTTSPRCPDASGTLVARCRPPRLVGRACWTRPASRAATCRGWSKVASPRHAAASAGAAPGACADGVRSPAAAATMRPRRVGIGAVRDGRGVPIARHLRRAASSPRAAFRPNPAQRRPRLLPLPAGTMAPDGGDAVGRQLPALGRRSSTGAADEAALLAEVETLSPRRAGAPAVPALSLGRAHAAQRSPCAGRVVRPQPRHRSRVARPTRVLEGVAFGLADGYRALRPSAPMISASRWSAAARAAAYGPSSSPARSTCRCAATHGGEVGAAFGAARAWPCWPPTRGRASRTSVPSPRSSTASSRAPWVRRPRPPLRALPPALPDPAPAVPGRLGSRVQRRP